LQRDRVEIIRADNIRHAGSSGVYDRWGIGRGSIMVPEAGGKGGGRRANGGLWAAADGAMLAFTDTIACRRRIGSRGGFAKA